MIFIDKNANLKAVAERNESINEHRCTNSRIPFCGHDFWDKTKKMEHGDVVLCNQCQVFYVKLKHLPWITKNKKWLSNEILSYGTNHLDGNWFAPISARITD